MIYQLFLSFLNAVFTVFIEWISMPKKLKGLYEILNLNSFILDEYSLKNVDFDRSILGWGRKKSFFKAQAYAQEHGLDAICLEDGFIRSLGLGKDGYPPLSLVVDDVGIYFDATQQSKLENLISCNEDDEFNTRAKSAINNIIKHGITKYNQKFEAIDLSQFSNHVKNILVIDQTYGDQSIKYAGANENTFQSMLKRACVDHPEAQIWVKTHPDVLAGKAKSHYSKQDLNHPRIKVLTNNFNPIELLQQVDEVYVVSSQMGFEALLCEKKVHCFGVSWYAGWGLTDDIYAPLNLLNQRRNTHKSLEHLFACAYFKYARYVNPVTGSKCELEDIIQLLIPNIENQKILSSSYVAYGFSVWKKIFISSFFNFPKVQLKFNRYLKPKKSENIVAWGKKAKALKDLNYKNVTTVEDGFIRSVGLGAELVRPCSLVFDDVGIYYDATQPSKIENLLQHVELDDEQIERAKALRKSLIELNISKYNVGDLKRINRPIHSHVLLVVGQVEDDLSIRLGGVSIKTNLDLLKKVRENNPDSYIIYKPHPDVQSGLRIGKIESKLMDQYANQIELDSSILQCFEVCDEVHTITSLSGFEALIRGIPVYCYGLPFYAGWGLTNDHYLCERRSKKVSLETLIYITLVQYASYNLLDSERLKIPLVRPEDVIGFIKKQRDKPPKKQSIYSIAITNLYRVFKK